MTDWSDYFERDTVGLGRAMLALFISWLLMEIPRIAVIALHAVPTSLLGRLLYFFVLVVGDVLTLRWCLGWFGWTISVKGAVVTWVLAGIAGAIAGVLVVVAVHSVVLATLAIAVVELLVAGWIVMVAAERVSGDDWDDHTPPPRRDRVAFGRGDPRLYTEQQFEQDLERTRLRKRGVS